MVEETKPERDQPSGGNGKTVNDKETKPDSPSPASTVPPKEFKVAEIWIRDGNLQMDGSEEFWSDKFRALGLLDYCRDIVKKYEPPKPKIIPAKGQMMDFVRQKFNRKGK